MHISDLRERLNYCERLRITSFQAWREITNEIIDGVMKEVRFDDQASCSELNEC